MKKNVQLQTETSNKIIFQNIYFGNFVDRLFKKPHVYLCYFCKHILIYQMFFLLKNKTNLLIKFLINKTDHGYVHHRILTFAVTKFACLASPIWLPAKKICRWQHLY